MTKHLPHDHGNNIDKVMESMPSVEDADRIAEIFKLISDPSRLRILWLLCHCEECVNNICAAMDMSAPAVSHHLKLLKSSGLVESHREGKEIHYKLAETEQGELLHHALEEMFEITCPFTDH